MSRTVVVIGGGYGGSAVAKALDATADVVLVDPRDAFVNSAGSLRGPAQPDWAGNMFFPFDTLLARGAVIRDRAASVDPGGVTLASGRRVEADHMVLATGSSYVGQPPGPDGSRAVPRTTVAEYKGTDLFTGRFAELFGTAGKGKTDA